MLAGTAREVVRGGNASRSRRRSSLTLRGLRPRTGVRTTRIGPVLSIGFHSVKSLFGWILGGKRTRNPAAEPSGACTPSPAPIAGQSPSRPPRPSACSHPPARGPGPPFPYRPGSSSRLACRPWLVRSRWATSEVVGLLVRVRDCPSKVRLGACVSVIRTSRRSYCGMMPGGS
jgi:hypothetical protein